MSRSNAEEAAAAPEQGTPLGEMKRGAFDAMSEEEQAFLQALAAELIGMLECCELALATKYAAQMFDIDEGLAFWSLLPAKVRTAIKRGKDGTQAGQ